MTDSLDSSLTSPAFIPLPNSRGLQLSPMGCGTWAWGNRLLWGYEPSMDVELEQVFNQCVRHGVTVFDTGDSYGTGRLSGQSEKLLGQFSQSYSGANADHICLATKLAPYPWRLTRGSMIQACEASAQRLQRPIDLAQLHWSTANYFPWQELPLLDGLMDLYEQGKIRGIGLSNFGAKRLRRIHKRFAERGLAIATLQVQYSLLSTAPVTELGVKDVCDELGIQLIAYSPLALGILTGKYSMDKLPSGLRGLAFRQILPGVEGLLSCLQAIAQER
ncbi:MAG: aldo/keto reductase, partial [Elainellaceae cyanobacterium]